MCCSQRVLLGEGSYYRAASDRWLARGYVVGMVEHSDGSEIFPNTATASPAFNNVLTWYDEYRTFWDGWRATAPTSRFCATGFSSGGHFVLLLGANRPSPAPSWSPSTLRAQLSMPVLIGHARNDTVVFPSQTRTLCTSAFPNCRAFYLAPVRPEWPTSPMPTWMIERWPDSETPSSPSCAPWCHRGQGHVHSPD